MAQNAKTAWDFKLIYPYVVCIISICVMLCCAISLVGNFVDYINPGSGGTNYLGNSEFTTSRVSAYNSFITNNKTEYAKISFEEYNKLKDKEATESLVKSKAASLTNTTKYLLYILIAAGFYIWHWSMIKRQK